ncbi:MAG TPA: ABC transporter permease, partial [Ottowia sp.]|nr:ABC transporter permease [Ottowia sp.]
MPHPPAWIETAADAGAVLQGRWTAGALGSKKAWRAAQAALAQVAPGAAWDLRALQAFDHLGALTLWQHWGRQWPAQLQAHEGQRALLERVASLRTAELPHERRGLGARVDAFGTAILGALAQLRDFVALAGQLLLSTLRLLAAPQRGPWRDFSGHLYRIGAQALPITALVGFLIGVVLAYLMSQVLRQFGAETFIVNILGLALIRELGPLLAAVLIAGRSGSAITAQIGVMRVTEEL